MAAQRVEHYDDDGLVHVEHVEHPVAEPLAPDMAPASPDPGPLAVTATVEVFSVSRITAIAALAGVLGGVVVELLRPLI